MGKVAAQKELDLLKGFTMDYFLDTDLGSIHVSKAEYEDCKYRHTETEWSNWDTSGDVHNPVEWIENIDNTGRPYTIGYARPKYDKRLQKEHVDVFAALTKLESSRQGRPSFGIKEAEEVFEAVAKLRDVLLKNYKPAPKKG